MSSEPPPRAMPPVLPPSWCSGSSGLGFFDVATPTAPPERSKKYARHLRVYSCRGGRMPD
jgi:hypothetical protein